MTVKTKTLLIIALTLAGLLLLVYIVSNKIILSSFEHVEQQKVHSNLERAVNALNDDLNNISSLARDWSQWDDTYAFIDSGSSDYIKSNLKDGSYTGSDLQIIVYLNTAGEVVYGRGYDRKKAAQIPVPKSVAGYFGADSLFLEAMRGPMDPVEGLLLLPEGPLHVVSRAILTSEQKGPSRGVLIMGRFLNDANIESLGNRTRLSLSMRSAVLQELPEDFSEAYMKMDKEGVKYVTRTLGPNHIAGYISVPDIYGQPALIFKIDSTRDIFQQGQKALNYLLFVITVTALIFGGVMVTLLQKTVIGRLYKLSRDVDSVRSQGNHAAKLHYDGTDEISNLTKHINAMLCTLNESHADLQNQKRLAEEANQTKSNFLSSMSHELRTPLNAILGFGQLLEMKFKKTPDIDTQEDIKDILDAGHHLLNLINEVLDLSRIEAGYVDVSLEAIPLHQTITECINQVDVGLARKCDITMINQVPDEDIEILADTMRFKQVFLNLLSNAVKYNKKGGTVTIKTEHLDNDCLRISITDSGKGIAAADMGKLFDPFERLSHKNSGVEGTGIGLTITKQLIEAMNGAIGVESKVGQGSTFMLDLPLNTATN